MNFNTSPIAFFPSRAAQIWRTWFAQRKISVICGPDLLPFYIIDNGNAPSAGELYDPNTDIKVADVDFQNHLLDHDISVEGQTRHIWIYQGEMAGVFGNTNPGYYYLKIGSWYSDVFRIGDLSKEYTEINWQFYDDIITADGTPISKHIKYKQIFETPLWHPEYGVEEEGKTNNGIFYATQQTTKKTSGFSAIVNESQLDCLNLTRMADNIIIKASLNGTTKTLQTNQFEISSKWQSDDVASIECQFDLFSIIRKYQQSNVEPEPLPIPTPPPTPANYYIKGTVETGTNTIRLSIDGTTTAITCTNGEFEFGYDNILTSLSTVDNGGNPLQNVDKIKTLNLADSDGLNNATKVILSDMPNCTSINFGTCTFASVTDITEMFARDSKLTSVSIPDGTFAAVADGELTFEDCAELTSISIPLATFAHGAFGMFLGCAKLATINLPLATFANDTSIGKMFSGCKKLATLDFSSATFASATTANFMFENATGIFNNISEETEIIFSDLFPADASQIQSAQGMFYGAIAKVIDLRTMDLSALTNAAEMFHNSIVAELKANVGQFDTITSASSMFNGCIGLNNNTLTLLAGETFAAVTDATNMFANADSSTHELNLTNATFANLTNATSMFANSLFTSISIPTATFASVTTANQMFYNCQSATEIELTSATFAAVTSASNIFYNLKSVVDIDVPASATWPLSFSLSQSTSLALSTFTKIAIWCKDLSGDTGATITLANGLSWKTMSNPMYVTAVGILSGKNWTVQ